MNAYNEDFHSVIVEVIQSQALQISQTETVSNAAMVTAGYANAAALNG